MSKPRSVLIVEDDDAIRDTIALVVSDYGYQAKMARNGQEALDYLRRGDCEDPCLILLDWSMPLVSGEEFLEFRRSADVIAAIPVVIVSASPPGKIPSGVRKVLRKPFEVAHLFSEIDEYCGEDLKEQILESAEAIAPVTES